MLAFTKTHHCLPALTWPTSSASYQPLYSPIASVSLWVQPLSIRHSHYYLWSWAWTTPIHQRMPSYCSLLLSSSKRRHVRCAFALKGVNGACGLGAFEGWFSRPPVACLEYLLGKRGGFDGGDGVTVETEVPHSDGSKDAKTLIELIMNF